MLASSIFHQQKRARFLLLLPSTLSHFQIWNSNSKMQAMVRLVFRLCRFYSLIWLIHIAELLWQREAMKHCAILRVASNFTSFLDSIFLHKPQAFNFTSSFMDSSWINRKLPILPHFHLCWLKKLTSIGKVLSHFCILVACSAT